MSAIALIAKAREHVATRTPIPSTLLAAIADELERRINRDDHLRAAWSVTAVDETPMRRAEALAAAVERFGNVSWPRTCKLDAPPAAWGEQSRSLWFAFRLGAGDVPRGWRQLHRLCRGADTEISLSA